MSKAKNIILRVQSPEGMKRIEISPNLSLRDLYESIYNSFKFNNYEFSIFKERNLTKELVSSRSQTIDSSNLKHGDVVYLKLQSGTIARRTSVSAMETDPPHTLNKDATVTFDKDFKPNTKNSEIVEDEIDKILSNTDGRIQRSRDSKLCRHNLNGCCVNCSPLEPYDENYLKEQKVKHLSFHSYLRKQMSGADRGKFVVFDDINCKIKPGCREHPPWPKGICSKCQPSAITLNRQIYRHVDNVMFENTALVERFLNYWRSTGHQRMGILYGTYEVHTDVPLGIRARVAAIYEPPQESNRDSIKLLNDEHSAEVDEVANQLGLKKVGWIFTDLISEDAAAGTVKHIRGIETHFLTADECILAGHLQNANPNACRYASNGVFGSKFVTVCVTGDSKKQVHMEGYAVSAQCMALVRDDCLIPTKDAPELGYVRESSDKQFVPDVYYKEKDQYGNEVQRLARPLPVEYLLVDVPASTPLTPIYTFNVCDNAKEPFPIENRYIDGQLQDFNTLCSYMQRWNTNEFLNAISDFHLLLYLYKMDMLPMKSHMNQLFEAVRTKNRELAYKFKKEEVWRTLETLITANSGSIVAGGGIDIAGPSSGLYPLPRSSAGGSGIGSGTGGSGITSDGSGNGNSSMESNWTCNHCTFINRNDHNNCEMCGLPSR